MKRQPGLKSLIRQAINANGKFRVVKVWTIEVSEPDTLSGRINDESWLTIQVQVKKVKKKRNGKIITT